MIACPLKVAELVSLYRFPNHFILNTEACTGWTGPPSERGVHLGQWSRGSDYAHSIIEVISYFIQLPLYSEQRNVKIIKIIIRRKEI